MARPLKNNAEYFGHPNDLRNDRRSKALRTKFGIEGYGIFNMLLEVLTHSDYFRIENTPLELELLAGDFGIDSKKLLEIVEYLLSLGLLQIEDAIYLSSPLIKDSLQHLQDYREKERNRNAKRKSVSEGENEVYHTVNSIEEKVYHAVNPVNEIVYPVVNTPKESKVKESKEKNSKGEKENKKEKNPPLENYSKKLREEPDKILEKKEEKEKSSAQKEKEQSDDLLKKCKSIFLKEAAGYFWDFKEDQYLQQLLIKIMSALPNESTPDKVFENFCLLIEKIPKYWRTKKFTIPHINENYNEIINEIKNNTDHDNSKHNSSEHKYGRHSTEELANRAKTFGRKNTGN